MAGEAQSTNFMLGTATVMLGPMSKLHELNPEEHSLGLVKNFLSEVSKSEIELGQGITNDPVFTRQTGSTARITCEAYEYTAKNLAYALSLNGASFEPIVGSACTLSAASVNNADMTHTLTVTVPADKQVIAVDDFVTIREPDNDNITLAKVESAGAGTLTVKVDVGVKIFAAGSEVQKCHVLNMGTTAESEEMGMKVVGQLANGTWVTFLFPRAKISSGLTMAFATDNFGNIPMEFKPLKLIPGQPNYADFKGVKGKLIINGTQSPLV